MDRQIVKTKKVSPEAIQEDEANPGHILWGEPGDIELAGDLRPTDLISFAGKGFDSPNLPVHRLVLVR